MACRRSTVPCRLQMAFEEAAKKVAPRGGDREIRRDDSLFEGRHGYHGFESRARGVPPWIARFCSGRRRSVLSWLQVARSIPVAKSLGS